VLLGYCSDKAKMKKSQFSVKGLFKYLVGSGAKDTKTIYPSPPLLVHVFSTKAVVKPFSKRAPKRPKTPQDHAPEVKEKLKEYVDGRDLYEDELKGLRKKWSDDAQDAREQKKIADAADRKRIVLNQAVRYREKQAELLAGLERDRQIKLRDKMQLLEYRERQKILRADWTAEQTVRYQRLIADLEHEKTVWITPENIDSKIVPELFEKPATTGLVNKHSDSYRWEVSTVNIARIMNSHLELKREERFMKKLYEATPKHLHGALAKKLDLQYGNALSNQLETRAQVRSSRKLLIEDFIEGMISTGEEREKYKEIIEDLYNSTTDDMFGEMRYVESVGQDVPDESFLDDATSDKYSRGGGEVYYVDEDDASAQSKDSDDAPNDAKGKKGSKADKGNKKVIMYKGKQIVVKKKESSRKQDNESAEMDLGIDDAYERETKARIKEIVSSLVE